MPGPVIYDVLREHLGDKPYQKGDTRELDPNDAAHLVQIGVLRRQGGEAEAEDLPDFRKREARPLNKAEGAAPENKNRPRVPRTET